MANKILLKYISCLHKLFVVNFAGPKKQQKPSDLIKAVIRHTNVYVAIFTKTDSLLMLKSQSYEF